MQSVNLDKDITVFHDGSKYEFPQGEHEVPESLAEAMEKEAAKAGVEEDEDDDTMSEEEKAKKASRKRSNKKTS